MRIEKIKMGEIKMFDARMFRNKNYFYASRNSWLKPLNFEGMTPNEAFSMMVEQGELIEI